MPDGYIVYIEIEPEKFEPFGTGPYRNVIFFPSAESTDEAVEKATDELPLRAYRQITSIRAVALNDMKELASW